MDRAVLSDSDELLNLDEGHADDQIHNLNHTSFLTNNATEPDINWMITQVLSSNKANEFSGSTENLRSSLNSWQISHLEKEDELGLKCLLKAWLVTQVELEEGSFCNATWDNVNCWPPTPLGMTVNRTCSDAFLETEPLYASHLTGHGYRECLENGSWLHDRWTNYTECADSFDAFVARTNNPVDETDLVTIIQYILFVGSVVSLIFILLALMTFCKFRSLWCDRVTIHVHLMTALMLRYIMLFIITEPHIFNRSTNYRSHNEVCRGVLIVYLCSTLSSISWMFIQGIYINGKLTTNIYDSLAPFKVYYTIGWLIPLGLIITWATIMSFHHNVHCWSGYAAMNEIWIIIFPIVLALIINFIFLINILRVLLTRVRTPRPNTDTMQFRRAAKATILLFPLLGVNNLLVLYNPGGKLGNYFVIINTVLSSVQGIFVAIGYCFLSNDVRAAYQGIYRRFLVRRNVNTIRRVENPQNTTNEENREIQLDIFPQDPVNSVNANDNPRPSSPINNTSSCSVVLNEIDKASVNGSHNSICEASQNSSTSSDSRRQNIVCGNAALDQK